jgi:sugar lactone lactonase YvrE
VALIHYPIAEPVAGALVMTKLECVCPVAATLGEGPFWSAAERAVWFVDIKGRQIHRYDERRRTLSSWNAPEDVGFIVPATGGRMICGLRTGLYEFRPEIGKFDLIVRVDAEHSSNRLNDACVDSMGRLWFGTMDDEETRTTGSLYRFDARGLTRCDTGYVITNGPAVSPDGGTMYHVDTAQRLVYAFDLDGSGRPQDRRVFVRIDKEGAYPDGPVVDSEGCIWLGLYGGWGAHRYSPRGELLETLSLPTANCTKPAFGGEDLRTLYLTTARKDLADHQLAEQTLAGALFAVRVDVPGLPQNEVRYES